MLIFQIWYLGDIVDELAISYIPVGCLGVTTLVVYVDMGMHFL